MSVILYIKKFYTFSSDDTIKDVPAKGLQTSRWYDLEPQSDADRNIILKRWWKCFSTGVQKVLAIRLHFTPRHIMAKHCSMSKNCLPELLRFSSTHRSSFPVQIEYLESSRCNLPVLFILLAGSPRIFGVYFNNPRLF